RPAPHPRRLGPRTARCRRPSRSLRNPRGALRAPLDHPYQPDPGRQMARLHWRPDLCRRHPRPPRSQRPPHRSRRRQPETATLQIDRKRLTTSPQLWHKSTTSRAPASQATSFRNAGRHHLGISGRLRRNLHSTMCSIYGCAGNIPTSPSNDMPTTLSAIAEAKHKRLNCVRRLKRGLRTANCNCIRKRPRSCIARMQIGPGNTRSGRSTFSAIHSGQDWRATITENASSHLSRRSVKGWQEDAAQRTPLAMHRRSDLDLAQIAAWVHPVLTGWVRYFGRFYPSKLQEELRTIDAFIVRWATRKYKRFQGHTMATWDWLRSLKRRDPDLFAHWRLGPAVR